METDEERYKRIFTTEFIKTQFHGHSEAYAEKYASVYAEIFCIAYNVKCKSESQEYAEQYAKIYTDLFTPRYLEEWRRGLKKFEEEYPEKWGASDFYDEQEEFAKEYALKYTRRYAEIYAEELMRKHIFEIRLTEKEKLIIRNLHKKGFSLEDIAETVDVELDFVEETLSE